MFNNVALDVFIGLIFVFLLYSLLATIIQEIIATRFAIRAKVLEKAILRMLEDGKTTGDIPYLDRINGVLHIFNLKSLMKGKKVAPWFYAHPLIKYLAEDNWYSKPAYISSANFSKVIMDLLKGFDEAGNQNPGALHDSIMAGVIHKLPINLNDIANPAIKNIQSSLSETAGNTIAINQNTALFIKSLWEDSGADIALFQQKLEQWFNDTMERATGWFKKYTRILLFCIGLAIAYFFNVDTLAIRRILTNNRTAREQMVSMAIASQEHLNPDKLLPGDSTRLDSTYNLVAADAEKSNNVLGLGRPWKDTLHMWKDSMKRTEFKRRLDVLPRLIPLTEDSIERLKGNIKSASDVESTLVSKKDSSKNSADSTRSSILIDSLRSLIQKDKSLLVKRSASLDQYLKLQHFQDRYNYIKSTVGDKWNLYSPNQRGGWETFLGWIITAMAVMLGAPFWFDMLSKIVNLRGTGSKVDTTDMVAQAKVAIVKTNSNVQNSASNANTTQKNE
jgi:hypothetical protein